MRISDFKLKPLTKKDATYKYLNWFKNIEIRKNIVFNKYNNLDHLKNYIKNAKRKKDYLLGVFFKDNHIGNVKFEKPSLINKKKLVSYLGIMIGDKNFRGKGRTHLILQKAIKIFKKKTSVKIYKLGVLKKNYAAIHCYKKSGFRILKENKNKLIMQNNTDLINLGKFSLGTAQMGLKYGINNKSKIINLNKVKKILNQCNLMGIRNIDTALVYGDAEKKLGKVGVKNFKVTSKIPFINSDKKLNIKKYVVKSLSRLRLKKLDCLLIHDPKTLKNKKNLSDTFIQMEKLKRKKLINKIGVSITDFNDLNFLLDNFKIDVIQVPFNILDQRIKKSLKKLKRKKIEIEVRSIFLQGLLFKEKNFIKNMFKEYNFNWNKLNYFFNLNKLSKFSYMINYVYQQKFIKRVIIGIDDVDQIKQYSKVKKDDFRFFGINCNNEKIINPQNWKLIQ